MLDCSIELGIEVLFILVLVLLLVLIVLFRVYFVFPLVSMWANSSSEEAAGSISMSHIIPLGLNLFLFFFTPLSSICPVSID